MILFALFFLEYASQFGFLIKDIDATATKRNFVSSFSITTATKMFPDPDMLCVTFYALKV